jgi:hypothetical protein
MTCPSSTTVVLRGLAGWMMNWCRGAYQPPVIRVKNIRDKMLKWWGENSSLGGGWMSRIYEGLGGGFTPNYNLQLPQFPLIRNKIISC